VRLILGLEFLPIMLFEVLLRRFEIQTLVIFLIVLLMAGLAIIVGCLLVNLLDLQECEKLLEQ